MHQIELNTVMLSTDILRLGLYKKVLVIVTRWKLLFRMIFIELDELLEVTESAVI
jgi:hypothetical protein